ncbi:variant 3, uroporphyrin-III C-methyltransferase [Lathyrus oleraceus]|uniref:Variant 3, uroporphyrin-III C-methyltransferase n=1 Tax=Pisum sativum TaxID=3888 RepID=A0A9D4ZV29_PEA|nr:variant 3, uroporphyrin-III C-methyltransferase [Pisum sativum]
MQNYLRKKELKERRENDLREGLRLYKNAKYEEALEKFESVLGTKPEPDEAAVASYNVACCYSKLNQVDWRRPSISSGPNCIMRCHTSCGHFVASNVHTFNVLAMGCRRQCISHPLYR